MKARLAAFSVIALLIGVAAGEADRIFGRGGNETLSSGVRADFLTGGVGRDGLNGGAGQDRVAAQYDNRRGVCTSPGRECSGGSDDYAASSQAVVGAVEFLRARGGKEIVLIGASVGAAWRGLVVTGLSGLLSAWCR
jgi:Ca2+-binding RTX toxin-like protein